MEEQGKTRNTPARRITPPSAFTSVLLPYQVRWLADTAPVKVCEKSRRVGLTWTEAADAALAAAAARGMDTWYIGYNREMAREFVETAGEWARRFERAAREIEEFVLADEARDILAYRIRFASGRKIVALSSRPSNLRGKQGRAVIDEAAFHDDLAGLLKAALAFTLWGGLVRIISTHNGADNPFNELVNDIRAGRRPYTLHRVTLDGALADGLFHRICQVSGREWSADGERRWRDELFSQYGDDAEEELLCVPRASGGAFLPSLLIESRMRPGVPVVRWRMPDSFVERSEYDRRAVTQEFCERELLPRLVAPAALSAATTPRQTFAGVDFGRSGDLTVVWIFELLPALVRRTALVVELSNIPFRQQEQVLFFVLDRLPRFTAGALDARGNGQYLAEAARQRYGSRISQVMLSIEWYRENMPRYKAAFEDEKIELPRDAEILADHRSLVVEAGVARVSERSRSAAHGAGARRHGDAAIAGALAFFASHQPAREYAYTPAPRLCALDEAGAPGLLAGADDAGYRSRLSRARLEA